MLGSLIASKVVTAQWGVTPADSVAIAEQVTALFGSSYEVIDIVNMDSVKANLNYAEGRFQDPNNLLQYCFLFTAENAQTIGNAHTGVVGVYRNNSIIWHSGTEIKEYDFSGSELYGTYDLLGDDKIEIISRWPIGTSALGLWIHRWDGASGTRINAIGAMGFTVIEQYGGLDFADVEGDGVWEIQGSYYTGQLPDETPVWQPITYSWNGQYYGKWPSTPQPSHDAFYPRDKVDVDVKGTVDQVQGLYRYRYRIQNKSTSIQKINQIIIKKRTDDLIAVGHRQGWSGFNGKGKIDWLNYGPLSGVFLYPTANYISKGEADSSFEFKTSALPYISNFYLQGYNKSPFGGDLNLAYQNAYINSQSGKTIAPTDPPSPFNKSNFIDSLKGYIRQSRTLNWITSQSDTGAYIKLLDTAKVKLQQNNVRVARAKLDTVLQKERQDSIAGALSSEAHALIKFNTQYLLTQTPQTPIATLTVNLTSGGSVTKSPNQTDYDSGMVVTLTALASTGYTFSNWSGGATGSINPLALTMNSTKTITPIFALTSYTISATAGSNGSISPSGSVPVNYGSNQTFTITANNCYQIDSVIVNGVNKGTVSSYTFNNVRGDSTIRTVYKIKTYTITPTAGPNGTISPSPVTTLNCGSSQTFTIAPVNSCYQIDSVIVNGANKGSVSSYTFNDVRGDSTIRTVYKIRTYTITPTAGANGTISPSTATTLNCGSSQTFTIAPVNSCYQIDSVIVNGANKGAVSSYTFNNVRGDSTIRTVYKIRTYTITATLLTGGGTINPSGPTPVNCGASPRFTFTPATGYRTDTVRVDGVKVDSTVGYTFTNITANHSITVKFKRTYQITVQTSPPNRIDSVDGIAYSGAQAFTWDSASTHRLGTRSPQTNASGTVYTWVSWSDSPSTIVHTVSAVSNKTYIARFNVAITDSVSFGWNMLSVPAVVSDFRKAALYQYATSSAFAYGLTTGYVDEDTLANGPAYWVKFGPSPSPITYVGSSLDYIRIAVDPGWNMIGSVTEKIAKLNVIAESTAAISNYFGYIQGGYASVDTLKPGKGYWVKASKKGTLALDLTTPSAPAPIIVPDQPPALPGAPSTPSLVSPANGATGVSTTPTMSWNPSEEATTYRLQVSSNSGFTTTVFDYAGITATSQQVSGLGYSTTYYWRVNASNQFEASNWQTVLRSFTTHAAPPPPCECCITSATTLDQFTVTDANGNAQAMYVRNSKRPLRMGFTDAEMPPKPLAGMFNARFKSNKFIESAAVGKSTRFQIDVGDAQGAVTLRWNLRAENNITYSVTRTGQPKVTLTGNGSMEMAISGNGTITITAQAAPPPCAE